MERALCPRLLEGATSNLRTRPRFLTHPRLATRCRPPLLAALRQPEKQTEHEGLAKEPKPDYSSASAVRRLVMGITAGCGAWASAALAATARIDSADPSVVIGPSSETLLGYGPDFSFTSLLFFSLLGYFFVQAVLYLSDNAPDGLDKEPDDPDHPTHHPRQQPPGSSPRSGPGSSPLGGDLGRAPIRSYVDSSQPAPGSDQDAAQLRNASLARSAAYRVAAAVRESLPRIHCLVEELGAAAEGPWPPPPPRSAAVDPVAERVYRGVLRERGEQGPAPPPPLCPRQRAALERVLLEEVAEAAAAEQVGELSRL
ncbi:hypothetical protein Agub_g1689, partial [Astrephomene gubernaculifera]